MPSRRSFFQWLTCCLGGGLLPQSATAASTSSGVDVDSAAVPGLSSVPVDQRFRDDRPIQKSYDLVIVGGGISGVCAAISAARHGVHVALVHNRPMLGGNSSSEVKLYPENSTTKHPWIKEAGILEELCNEDRARNHREYREGTMNAIWDLVLYDGVFREPNIDLYLNTHMHQAIMDSPARMKGVFCFQLGTEKTFELFAPLFVDASGDGYLGYRAGAEFRWGPDARADFNEPLAPVTPGDGVMGNTQFFMARDTGQAVPFQSPDWAASFPTEESLGGRSHSHIEGGYWWIEIGAPHHPIHDNDKIVHEGLRHMLGVWDHIKNRGEHGAANYGLEFLGFWPYKREARRLLGDYVLTQRDLQQPPVRSDDVAYGAWLVDVHAPGGLLQPQQAPYDPPASDEHWDRLHTLPYGIPLRALYSRNIENLLMAGRPISTSYVAFSSSRVLRTGAIVGQAVGVAAALCKQLSVSIR
ncbi:MAG: FAD-dependent oxidoreductase, partial [Planctomycetaceae bacterium]|nr:FAD-dependent oxidoreductase [Planctomycetaceae bacterium]